MNLKKLTGYVELPLSDANRIAKKMYKTFDDQFRPEIIDIAFEINNLEGEFKDVKTPEENERIVERLAYLFMKETFLEILLGYLDTEYNENNISHKSDDNDIVIVPRRPYNW